jgi:hypothetical protein
MTGGLAVAFDSGNSALASFGGTVATGSSNISNPVLLLMNLPQ